MKVADHSFMDPEIQEDPATYYDALLEQAPVFFMPQINAFVVSGFKEIQFVVIHPELYSIDFRTRPDAQLLRHQAAKDYLQSEGFPRFSALTTDPPAHTAYRAAVSKAFMPGRVKSLVPFVQQAVAELIETLCVTRQCEFMKAFAWILPIRVITKLFGLPDADADQIKHWSDVWIEPLAHGLSEEREMAVAREEVALQRYLVRHMEAKLESPGEDILTDLANARMPDGTEMPLAEKVGIAEHLIVGGHETATSALGSGMMLLAQRPDLANELRAEPARIDNFVEEVLRLESPSQGFFRVAVQDSELNGVHIPQGSMVHLRFAAANRDPGKFPQPQELNLDRRTPRGHLAFRYGVHHCLGAPYARLELQTAFRSLLHALDDITIDPAAAALGHLPGLSLRTLKELNITYRVSSRHGQAR